MAVEGPGCQGRDAKAGVLECLSLAQLNQDLRGAWLLQPAGKALGRKVLGGVREPCLFFCSEQVVSGKGMAQGIFLCPL